MALPRHFNTFSTSQSLIGSLASCMDEDKKKTKKWKKKKGGVDGEPDLRLHRAETAHVSSVAPIIICPLFHSSIVRVRSICFYYEHTLI